MVWRQYVDKFAKARKIAAFVVTRLAGTVA